MKNRSGAIEALRLIFMTVIALWHFGRINPFTHGYIAVDFYFMLSGYLLYYSYTRHKYDALTYTIQKLKRFYPEYALVFFFVVIMKLNLLLRDNDVLTVILNAISEGLLIHSVGVFGGGANQPTWYLSVLIIGGGLVYAILYWNKKVAVSIIFPLIVLLAYTYLLGLNGSTEHFATNGPINQPLLRGVAGMSLGCLLAILKDRYYASLVKSKCVLDVASLLSVIVVGIVMFSVKNRDGYALLSFAVLIISSFVPSTLINKMFSSSLWIKLGGITYEMLLVHSPVIWVLNKLTRSIKLPFWGIVGLAIVYLSLVLLCSVVLKYIGKKFRFGVICQNKVKSF